MKNIKTNIHLYFQATEILKLSTKNISIIHKNATNNSRGQIAGKLGRQEKQERPAKQKRRIRNL